jgi:hypothetical protein
VKRPSWLGRSRAYSATASSRSRPGSTSIENRWPAAGELTSEQRFILLDCVETNLELTDGEQQEFKRLHGLEAGQEVTPMEMPWADKIEARARKRGSEVLGG